MLLAIELTPVGSRALAVLAPSATQRVADARTLALPSSVALAAGTDRALNPSGVETDGFSPDLAPGLDRWPLLAEPIYRRLGLRLEQAESAGVRIVASDQRALAVGRRLAERLAPRQEERPASVQEKRVADAAAGRDRAAADLGQEPSTPSGSRPDIPDGVSAWVRIDVRALEALVRGVVTALDDSPLVAPSDLDDLRRLLALVQGSDLDRVWLRAANGRLRIEVDEGSVGP